MPREIRRFGAWGAPALVLLAVVLLVGCGLEETEPATDAPASDPVDAKASFVGRAACIGCHPSEAKAWAGSHHDRAMEVPSADAVEGPFDGRTFEVHGERWRFFRGGADWLVGLEAEGREGIL